MKKKKKMRIEKNLPSAMKRRENEILDVSSNTLSYCWVLGLPFCLDLILKPQEENTSAYSVFQKLNVVQN